MRLARVTFKHLLSRKPTRVEAAVTLQAILELIKQRTVQAEQQELFGEIKQYVAGFYVGLLVQVRTCSRTARSGAASWPTRRAARSSTSRVTPAARSMRVGCVPKARTRCNSSPTPTASRRSSTGHRTATSGRTGRSSGRSNGSPSSSRRPATRA